MNIHRKDHKEMVKNFKLWETEDWLEKSNREVEARIAATKEAMKDIGFSLEVSSSGSTHGQILNLVFSIVNLPTKDVLSGRNTKLSRAFVTVDSHSTSPNEKNMMVFDCFEKFQKCVDDFCRDEQRADYVALSYIIGNSISKDTFRKLVVGKIANDASFQDRMKENIYLYGKKFISAIKDNFSKLENAEVTEDSSDESGDKFKVYFPVESVYDFSYLGADDPELVNIFKKAVKEFHEKMKGRIVGSKFGL